MSTDIEWEKWGARDPYFSVLTDPKFRRSSLDDAALKEFFTLGQLHVHEVLQTCRERLNPDFKPRRVLDFGCGVGRLVLPFAAQAEEVVGVDVSPSMLLEAQANCDRAGVSNVKLLLSDDDLSAVNGRFDLVHSCIVLQHIEIPRGLAIFDKLLNRIEPGGIGVLQITFGWDIYSDRHGIPPAQQQNRSAVPPWRQWIKKFRGQEDTVPANPDPEMQMNFYNMSQVLFMIQRTGTVKLYTEFTDHGGAIGAFLYFRLPCRNGSQEQER
jgi:SAM-dependent methyltransferase